MSSSFDLEHLCRLSQLRLEPEEKATIQPQLENIVLWVGKLAELALDQSNASPEGGGLALRMRPDHVGVSFPPEIVLQAAPESDEHFIKVPKVIEER